jgi:HEAT repeat protein
MKMNPNENSFNDTMEKGDEFFAINRMEFEKDVNGLIGALRSKHEEIIQLAAAYLVKIREPAVEPLIKALKSDLAPRAAVVLGFIKDERAIPPLMQALENKYFSLRAAAIEALGNMRVTQITPKLIKIINNDYNEKGLVLMASMNVLADFKEYRARDQIKKIADDREQPKIVRKAAKEALKKLK